MKQPIDLESENNRKDRAMLIGKPGTNLSELSGLVDTLGMEIADKIVLPRLEITASYGMGTGKAQELANHAKACNADCIIMDFELEPTKQRNWERLSHMPVFDRQEVIIRIFGQRAQTREAVLQVELAKLNYSLPRLAHMYGDMARQRGGNYGSKGSGEKQLELDRRQVRERIQKLTLELKKVSRNRETQRKRREKIPLPSCALAGYTNAGKSSLMNALTNADAFVENKLFATLDPLTRHIKLNSSLEILLTDTVGFISNLPHSLIDAFKSTLEEAARADLLLIVLDASDPNANLHIETIENVLKEIGAEEKNKIIVLNKIDVVKETALNNPDTMLHFSKLRERFPDAICTSTLDKTGLDVLKERIVSCLQAKFPLKSKYEYEEFDS